MIVKCSKLLYIKKKFLHLKTPSLSLIFLKDILNNIYNNNRNYDEGTGIVNISLIKINRSKENNNKLKILLRNAKAHKKIVKYLKTLKISQILTQRKRHIIYNIHHSLNLELKEKLLTFAYKIINIFNIKRKPEVITCHYSLLI